jgi:hypothetical protein
MQRMSEEADPMANQPVLVCTHCGCEIEFCSFCDRTECPAACCYGCLVIALGEAKPPIHAHGG